jgi:predicted TIM-barrel fold metal-dependent hydrolase
VFAADFGGVLADIGARAGNERHDPDRHAAAPAAHSGLLFRSAGQWAAALDEIERCCDAGMVGVKLYDQYKYDDPVVFPIAERCIQKRLLLLGHSGFVTDPRTLAAQPRISHARDFGALSRRYPELMLILGHVNGGGDWEWTLRTLREFPNVHLDTSGSVLEDDTIGDCVRMLGWNACCLRPMRR